jgi:hypothetical protein
MHTHTVTHTRARTTAAHTRSLGLTIASKPHAVLKSALCVQTSPHTLPSLKRASNQGPERSLNPRS